MDLELKPVLTGSPDCPAEAVHGSYLCNWSSIQQQGLSRMRRTHIHLAPGLPGEEGVISGKLRVSLSDSEKSDEHLDQRVPFISPSGMRKDCDLAVYIDVFKALAGKLSHCMTAPQYTWFSLYVQASISLICFMRVSVQTASSSSGQIMVCCWLKVTQRENFSLNILAEP